MDISNSTALVTGASRGLGREFARQLQDRGAAKVYAAVRRPGALDFPGVVPVPLDVTDPAQVRHAAALATDVDLLINNAGIATFTDPIAGDVDGVRRELDVNLWGALDVLRAFSPILGANGGGAIVSMLSILALRTYPGSGAYAISKAAAWAMTDTARLQLKDQGTQVLGVFLASVDTDMVASIEDEKSDPAVVVSDILDALEAGRDEVFDRRSEDAKGQLHLPPAERFPWL